MKNSLHALFRNGEWLLVAIFLTINTFSFAQQKVVSGNADFIKLSAEEEVKLKSSIDFLQKQVGEKSELFSFEKVSETVDKLKMKHLTFRQSYKNVPIEFSMQKVHGQDGKIKSISGEIHAFENINTTPNISSEEAFIHGLNHLGYENYDWSDEKSTAYLEGYRKPVGQLMILPALPPKVKQPTLVYKFDIRAESNQYWSDVYVGAAEGNIILEISKIHHNDTSASGQSIYNGIVNFTAEETFPGAFQLRQTTNGNGIWTVDAQGSTYSSVSIQSNSTTFNHPVGCQAHWGAEKTHEYFSQTHGRNSYDGNGAQMRLFVNDAVANNAGWYGNKARFGSGNGTTFNPLVSLDIVGHEFSHGVIQTSANLIYMNESGALNESFADIFGECIEFFGQGSHDWLVGADFTVSANALRSFSNPNSFNDPDTYLGQYWATGSFDYGGVHTNSGVQNYWFYLLSNGGNGINDNNENYAVTAIGMEKAAAIAYRSLTQYLTQTSDFFDARAAAIQSAEDLYGVNMDEVKAVKNAWHAVGVGPAANDNSPPAICGAGALTLNITFDNNPQQVGAYIQNSQGNFVFFQPLGSLASETPGNTKSIPIGTLPTGKYFFVMGDWGPDGMCCVDGSGSYELTDGTNILASGSTFDFLNTHQFCVNYDAGADYDLVPPTTPTIISATPSETSIDLTWTSSTDDNGALYYVLFYGEAQLESYILDTSHTLTGLTPNTTYTLTAFAIDQQSNASDKSNQITVTTLPSAPACASGNMTLEIQLDAFPEQTAWEIKDINNTILASSGNFTYFNQSPNALVVENIPALPDGNYILVVYDVGGDGLCCANGNGYYTLKDAQNNVIVNGASFAFSDVTQFCSGMSNGDVLDTQAPTIPTNLMAFNPTQNSIEISYTPSTDNVGIIYYGLFMDGVYLGYFTTNTPNPLTLPNLQPNTTYDFQLVARDLAGNFSGYSNIASETTLPALDTIHEGYFETGWDGWTDGGNDCRRINNSARAFEGNRSVRLRDNSGVSSSMTLSNLDLSTYSEVTLDFEYYLYSFENNEDFWVRYNDGNGWVTVATYQNQVDFNGDGFYSASVTLDANNYNLSSNAQWRIQCDASGNGDQVFVDQVILSGVPASSSAVIAASNEVFNIPTIKEMSPLFLIAENVLEGDEKLKPMDKLKAAKSDENEIRSNIVELRSDHSKNDFEIKIAPNPATDYFQIYKGEGMDEMERVSIYSLEGSLVASFTPSVRYDISHLEGGMYIVQIDMVDGTFDTVKIMVQ